MDASRSTRGATRRSCDRCGEPVLRQLVGHRAALKVTADAVSITAEEATQLIEPNRLAWCVAELHGGVIELRWRCRTKNECGHGLVIEHRCAPEAAEYGRRPEGGLW